MEESSSRIPDAIEPIVGYRVWVYQLGGQRSELLHSLSFGADIAASSERWSDAGVRWIVALCRHHRGDRDHIAPVEDCTCGFYAMNSINRLLEAPELRALQGRFTIPEMQPWLDGGLVLGQVLLAGKVIEHERGYRAERARLLELIPIEGSEHAVMRLAAELQVPIGHSVQLPSRPDRSPAFPTTASTGPSRFGAGIREWLRLPGARWFLLFVLVQIGKIVHALTS